MTAIVILREMADHPAAIAGEDPLPPRRSPIAAVVQSEGDDQTAHEGVDVLGREDSNTPHADGGFHDVRDGGPHLDALEWLGLGAGPLHRDQQIASVRREPLHQDEVDVAEMPADQRAGFPVPLALVVAVRVAMGLVSLRRTEEDDGTGTTREEHRIRARGAMPPGILPR